jgi:hypothetical protein
MLCLHIKAQRRRLAASDSHPAGLARLTRVMTPPHPSAILFAN